MPVLCCIGALNSWEGSHTWGSAPCAQHNCNNPNNHLQCLSWKERQALYTLPVLHRAASAQQMISQCPQLLLHSGMAWTHTDTAAAAH